MFKNIITIAIITLAFSCTKKEEKIPATIIAPEKMKQILIDIHMLEGTVNASNMQADTATATYNSLQEKLFQKHGIKQVQFDSSMAYYTRHLEDMDKIYTGVIDSLTVKEALLNAK